MSGPKTEEPTPRRLRRALEEGDAGVSSYASSAAALLVGAALTPLAVTALAGRVGTHVREAIAATARGNVAVGDEAVRAAWDVVALSAPLLGALSVAALAATLVQTGGFVGMKRLAPRLDRLNVVAGAKAIFSRVRVFGVLRAMSAAVLVGGVVGWALLAHAVDFARTAGRLGYAAPAARAITISVAWQVAAIVAVIAATDVAVVRVDRRRRLRMSRDEVERERKEAEGDPLVKGERARARDDLLAHGSALDVRRATVVILDAADAEYTLNACALCWAPERGDRAPVVVASGEARLARGIARTAGEHGVAVVERAALASALATARAGDEIPEALYDDVAEILRDLAGEKA